MMSNNITLISCDCIDTNNFASRDYDIRSIFFYTKLSNLGNFNEMLTKTFISDNFYASEEGKDGVYDVLVL